MKAISFKFQSINFYKAVIVLALFCAPIISWPAIKEFDKIALFGIFLLPFILRFDKQQIGAYRYVIISIVFAIMFLVFGQSYLALACGISLIFSVIELKYGKLNEMAFFALLFYLPITRSFFMLFGFYIRLEITKWAAKLISVFSSTVSFTGTQIFHNGEQFSVDSGCMGLRLVITGFILTLLILNQTSIAFKIKLKPWVVSLFITLSFLLIVMANFFRIVFLIAFKSGEGTVSHELIGVLALIVFHLIPMVFIIRTVLKKDWVKCKPVLNSRKSHGFIPYLGILTTSVFMLLNPNFSWKNQIQAKSKYSFAGYETKKSMDGIVTYSRGNTLFTIKPINPLSFSNHHPMICWRGDGFEISNEKRSKIGEYECMRAQLKSNTQTNLSTVWWYSNNFDCITSSELEWRIRSLFRQEKFYILNFTSDNDDELSYTINSITKQIENQNVKMGGKII